MNQSQRHQSSFEDDEIEMFDEDGNEIEDTNEDLDIFEDSPLDPEFGLNTMAAHFDDL